jgi:hypothetical protein
MAYNPLKKPSPKDLITAYNRMEEAYVIAEAHNRYRTLAEPYVDMESFLSVHQDLQRAAHWAQRRLDEKAAAKGK